MKNKQLIVDFLSLLPKAFLAVCLSHNRGHGVKQVEKGGSVLFLLRLDRRTAGEEKADGKEHG